MRLNPLLYPTLRHSARIDSATPTSQEFATLLHANGEDVKVVQELLVSPMCPHPGISKWR